MTDAPASGPLPTGLDTTVSHSARVWNYWLGGDDNFPVDRKVGKQIIEYVPELVRSARADRQFLARAISYLAGEAGIRQFLDIGTGLPTADNTHQVAQRVAPASRIVYVDNDPLVLAHARALLTSTPEGACDYIEADVQEPRTILTGAARTLDLSQPVAVMMLGILNFVLDDGQAAAIVREFLAAVPAGSYLVISHPTTEVDGPAMTQAVKYWNSQGSAHMRLRTAPEVTRLFDGADLVEPGVVSCSRWRPDSDDDTAEVTHFGGVARKPSTPVSLIKGG